MSTEDNVRGDISLPEAASRASRPAGGLRLAIGVIRFLLASWKANLASTMEYRLSFVLLAGMMFVNNLIWLFFWSLFFHHFPVVRGWGLEDVMMLWAVGAGGFGWVSLLFGNFSRIASIVSSGQLDVYLAQPKPILLNVIASRTSVTAAGDFLFGIVIFAIAGNHSLYGFFAFALGLLLAGLLYLGVVTIAGCLAFFIGNSEGIATQALNSFISLTIYPSDIFKGFARLALFSVVPAGFISYLPIGLLRGFEPTFAYSALAATALFVLLAIVLFHLGLRRYSSGNAMAMRN